MDADLKNFVTTATNIATAVMDNRQTSLAQFVKPTLIESPCFIQDSIAEEAVLNDILKNLYNVYVGYVITALQMNTIIKDGRKVRDILSTVSTTVDVAEHFIDTSMLIEGLSVSVEAYDPYGIPVKDKTPGEKHDPLYLPNTKGTANDGGLPKNNTGEGGTNRGSNVTGNKLALDKVINVSIASGRQIELEFIIPGQDEPLKLLVTVRFNPRIIPSAVTEYILEQDLSQPLTKRWIQLRAGEISFMKDFVFGMDKLERREKALKADKDGAMQDLFFHTHKSKLRQVVRNISKGPADKQRNIANAVIILDEAKVNRFTKRTGFKFTNASDRRNFFANTYSLFIVLVDTSYSRVTIYTNGLDQGASYSFSELKSSAASDKMSIKDVLDYLSKNQMPKF